MPPVDSIDEQLRAIRLALDGDPCPDGLELRFQPDALARIGEHRAGPGRVTRRVDNQLMLDPGRKVDFDRGLPSMDTADGYFGARGHRHQGEMGIRLA